MDEPHPHHVGHLIRRAQQIHNKVWSTDVSSEVTSPQMALLVALTRYPGIDQRTLGALVSLDRSTTADVVERMLGRGYVQKTRDPGDRRRNVLRLTEAGELLVKELQPRTEKNNDRLLGLLPPDDAQELVRLLTSFVTAAADVEQEEIELDRSRSTGGRSG
ncbi:MAG: winged helix-turn-helix transcriptional regulator [Acidimicrobiales bacterium]|nr:winged helix-turn-helix transcriptional regulator [Acidimicrobiales bacterium]MBO0885927.1 winged helix-turn-helix transcriptional regulator [Acidimicrobiales bacterium]MBO0892859.1 winged helix-turn-helix transcriptional regulator [Acidimicrobiales bacterium]